MLILTDLDDTLFQTARKCPADGGDLHVMSFLENGDESGYATIRQQRLLAWLKQGRVVPVTARSRDVLARVNIAQAPAICSNGGCIITEDGIVDPEWHSHLVSEASRAMLVCDAYDLLTKGLDPDAYRRWIVSEGDLALYIVIKSNIDDGSILADLENDLAAKLPAGWRVHRNGNNLAYLPPWLNKRNATKYLIEKYRSSDPHLPVIGMGDSHSDVGFMDLCDYAMASTRSQIWNHTTKENSWC